MKNMKIFIVLTLSGFFFALYMFAPIFAAEEQKTPIGNSEKDKTLADAIVYLKDGDIKEAGLITSKISSIESLADQEKTALFDGFYDGFVKLSKAFRLEDTVQLAAEWARLYPREKTVILYYASLLSEKGNNIEAKDRFEVGFGLEERYRKVDGTLLNNFYNNAAGNSADTEDWKKSFEYISKIEKADKKYFNLGLLKCRVYFYLDRFEEGLRVCENVFKSNPRNAGALDYVTYAGYYRKNKNYGKSLEITMESLKKFPLADGIAMTAAADHIRLGNYYQALMLCIREDMIALRDFYNNKNIQELKQTITDAIVNKKTIEAEKAAKVFSILKLLNDKKYEDAIKLMDELNENTLIYRESLEIFRGEALEALGKYKEAEAVYNYILSRDPTLVMTYCKLFELYMKKTKERDKAMETYAKARKIKPEHWRVLQIEEWLKNQK
jgi:tetratricopeptide (TPR) repeat protein